MVGEIKDVIIWGAGALGEHVHYLFSYDSQVRVRAFPDDNPGRVGKLFHDLPVLPAGEKSFA